MTPKEYAHLDSVCKDRHSDYNKRLLDLRKIFDGLYFEQVDLIKELKEKVESHENKLNNLMWALLNK